MGLQERREARYREKLREALLKNHQAVYHALMYSDPESLDEQLAMFLLEEAGWDLRTFLAIALVRDADA